MTMDYSKELYVEDIASRVKSRKRACASKIANFVEISNDDHEPAIYQDDDIADPSFKTKSVVDIMFSEETPPRRKDSYRRPARRSYRRSCSKGIIL